MDEQEHRRKVEAVFRKHAPTIQEPLMRPELVTALCAERAARRQSRGPAQIRRRPVGARGPDDDDAVLTLSEFQKLFDLGTGARRVQSRGHGRVGARPPKRLLRRLGVPRTLADATFSSRARRDRPAMAPSISKSSKGAFESVPLASPRRPRAGRPSERCRRRFRRRPTSGPRRYRFRA